jgi:murein DD-endopeptidase MepM/ murein hydrolase activator NlpD
MIPRSNFSEWIWPIPMYMDNEPVVSDGYGRGKRVDQATGKAKGHYGVDIMHSRRKDARDVGAIGTKNFVTYPGEEALVVGPGMVQEVSQSQTGHFVRINHRVGAEGKSILSVYRHLINVRPTIIQGQLVKTGDPIGLLGDSPIDGHDPIHLHFELWDISQNRHYPEATFDPALVMHQWRVKRHPQGDIVPHPHPPKPGPTGWWSAVGTVLLTIFVHYLMSRRS